MPQFYDGLLQSAAATFVEDEFVENGEDLFPVVVKLPQIIAEVAFVLAAGLPLLQKWDGYVDVAAEGVDRVAPEE
jgi:hypothetical protein